MVLNINKYIGVKLIHAEPMKRGENDWYKVVYEDGYVSWSPKEVFEKAYIKCTDRCKITQQEFIDVVKNAIDCEHKEEFTFGVAIQMMKVGHHMSRKGWNGKGMFAYYQKGYPEGIPCNKQTAIAVGLNEGDLFKCRPYLQLKCVDGSYAMWVPSINDILAEDWIIY